MLPLWSLIRLHRQRLTAATFLLLAVFLLFVLRADSPGVLAFKGVLANLLGGMQRLVLSPVEATRAAGQRLQELGHLDEENLRLKRLLANVGPMQLQLDEALKENRRLRQILRMSVDPHYTYTVARVVGDSSSAFSRVLLVNAGAQEKVRPDTPAVSPAGVVGRVVAVGTRRSTVLTLHDINSRVPVQVQRSRLRAMVAGTNSSTLELRFVVKGGDILVGDLLITSGTGGVFPKGVGVARVTSLNPNADGLFMQATARALVDLDRLEELRLMLPVVDAEPLSEGEEATITDRTDLRPLGLLPEGTNTP
ncbi:rod shape-determining protein MreC [Magnetococcus marinus MC-1]|uniref:Cell shape-determining protein MreC n=1 Tax=Magnetococcus marinus (strain ATCC BAA-1437 / JCM 17883 / MC-1) TaxID=156889 RepID=A0L7I1_MAGMM|nr:rod shape-determining protein MreC [Magnetococcus marinus]ABK43924.1 rod shape-determining protein MreC [Magnetococcus marinus MC-1]